MHAAQCSQFHYLWLTTCYEIKIYAKIHKLLVLAFRMLKVMRLLKYGYLFKKIESLILTENDNYLKALQSVSTRS